MCPEILPTPESSSCGASHKSAPPSQQSMTGRSLHCNPTHRLGCCFGHGLKRKPKEYNPSSTKEQPPMIEMEQRDIKIEWKLPGLVVEGV